MVASYDCVWIAWLLTGHKDESGISESACHEIPDAGCAWTTCVLHACSVSCGQRNPLHGGQGLQSLRGPSRFKQTCLENSASCICISRTKRESQWVSCFIAWNNGRSKVLKALNASCSGYLFFLRAHRQLTKLRILSNESLHGTADTVDKCSFGSSLRQWASRASPSPTRWVFKLWGETSLSEGRSACWLDGVPLAKGETRTASMAQIKSIMAIASSLSCSSPCSTL